MDRIVHLLNTDNLTSDECYAYLGKDAVSDLPLLFSEHAKLELAQNLFLKLKKNQSDFNKIDLLQIASGASSNIADGVDVNVKLTASRLLLGVCTTPVSSAFGILSSNVLNQIIGVIFKVSVDNIHNRSSVTKRRERDIEDDDEDEGEGSQMTPARAVDLSAQASSLFLLLKEIYEAGNIFWHRSEEYLLDAFSEALVAVVCLGSTKIEVFSECAKMAGAVLALFSCQNESCLMMTYRNLLPIVTLAGRDMKLPDAGKYKVQCHVSACRILAAIMQSCRGAVASWAIASKKHSAPGSSAKKTPRSKQRGDGLGAPTPATSASTPGTPAAAGTPSTCTVPGSAIKTPQTTGSSGGALELKFAVPYTCAIGLIQRLLLTASERMIPRVTIVSSVVTLVNALQSGGRDLAAVDLLLSNKSDKKKAPKAAARVSKEQQSSNRRAFARGAKAASQEDRAEESDDEQEASPEVFVFPPPRMAVSIPIGGGAAGAQEALASEQEQQRAVSRVLSFLIKLSKSAKLHHRSLSLDIGASLLQEDWLISNYHVSAEVNDADSILQMLVERCSDVAATVRSRSLGALWDLLENLANIKRFENLDFFTGVYSLLVGGGSLGASFLDRLRELACDNKPLVRVKAIQTLVLALTIEWPKVAIASLAVGESPTAGNIEYVQLYLSDDDVSVIAERCSDQSIAVRKQAIVSLSAILQCRPVDSLLQEAWIDAVLPLVMDPESSVQAKVTQSVFDIVLQAAADPPSSSTNEAAWSICSKIGECGCTKLLQTAVTLTKKNGLLRSVPERTNSVVLNDVLKAVKQACCVMLVGAEGKDINADENMFLSQENGRQDIHTLRQQDYEVVSNGAWILLEALTAQDVSDSLEQREDDGTNSVSADFVVRCWLSRRQHNNSNIEGLAQFFLDELEVRMLRVMAKVSSSVKLSSKRTVCGMLRQVLSAAQCDAQGVSAAMTVLFSFSNETLPVKGVKEGRNICDNSLKNIQEFTGQLLNVAHEILFRFIWGSEKPISALFASSSAASASPVDFRQQSPPEVVLRWVSCALFFIGDISMLGFSVEEDEDSYVAKQRKGSSHLPTYLVSDASGTFKIHIPDVLVTMVQILMGHQLPDSASASGTGMDESLLASDDDKHNNNNNNVSALSMSIDDSVVFSAAEGSRSKLIPNRIRAQAFVIMGKLCLRSRVRARDHVNVFLRELKPSKVSNNSTFDSLNHSGSALSSSHFGTDHAAADTVGSHAVRSNSLIVLGDLCVRFTNLVDRHVGSMSGCLQDPDVMVRRHAFVLLTQLLLQEYIKWRGMLLFRFLAVVVDRDEEMAELSKYVLRHTLQTKYSGFMVQNFSEAIIVFNNCSGHATYRAMAAIGADGGSCAVSMDGIDLSGSFKKSQRLQIYQFMMEDITEEEKIQITANLSQDILAYALDFPIETSVVGGGALSPFESALEDAFAVLRSPLLRVGSKRGGASSIADDEEEAGDTENAIANEARTALHKAKTKVLKKLSVQHLVDHMLPVVSSLKHYLECKRSPVQKSLMEYLMYLVSSHKAEVAQALSSDPGLKDEIEYDIKLYEREKNEEQKRHKIHAAEKAVLNLEKSTTRKSSAKAAQSLSSRSSPDDGFTDRMVALSSGGVGGSRRNSRASAGSPQLHGSSKVRLSGGLGSSGYKSRRGTPHADDLSGRLGVGNGAYSPRTSIASYVPSARKWTVNIGALDDVDSGAATLKTVSGAPSSVSRKKRGLAPPAPARRGSGSGSVLGTAGLLGVVASVDEGDVAPHRKKTRGPETSTASSEPAAAGRRGSTRTQKKGGSDSLFSLK